MLVEWMLRSTIVRLAAWSLLATATASAQLISDLPLNGDLRDRVTGRTASFARSSVAFTLDGRAVPPDGPRFERFAVAAGYVWRLESDANELAPAAIADGVVYATTRANDRIYASLDGEAFEPRGALPFQGITMRTSAWPTPNGALLVAGVPVGHNIATLYRSDDGGWTFTPVLTPHVGWFQHWNVAAVGGVLFVSEYGLDSGDNPRFIFRSLDDGVTWQLVYEPPPITPPWRYHNHQTLGDPWRGHVYQSHGCTRPGVLRSVDGGDSWEQIHDFYMPISGCARREAIYWGSDGIGGSRISRYDPLRNRWTAPLVPWNGYNPQGEGSTWTGNVCSIAEHAGVLYAPFCQHPNQMWASADGEHWALLRGFTVGDWGTYTLLGVRNGWMHGLYYRDGTAHTSYLRFRPGRVVTLTGLRLEPACENLVRTAQGSSAEEGLAGWQPSPQTVLSWNTAESWHGAACVSFSNPNQAVNCLVRLPVAAPVPVGTVVRAQIRLRGDESALTVRLADMQNNLLGPVTLASASDEWTTWTSEMTATRYPNALALLVHGYAVREGSATVHADGYQLTTAQTGLSWQLGGTPRAAERVRAVVEFPGEWTDFLCFRPDYSCTDSDLAVRTLKAWVQDEQNYARLAYDAAAARFVLTEVRHGFETDVAVSGTVANFWRHWTHRIGVRVSGSGTEFRVRIGTAEDAQYSAVGPALTVAPSELWIGGSPAGDDQAPGVYALSRTFAGALGAEAFAQELEFLPTFEAPGDCNCDGQVNLDDVDAFVAALAGVDAYLTEFPGGRYANADCNGDERVDFDDLDPFVALLGRRP